MSKRPIPVTIRKEKAGDESTIFALTKAAFAQMEYSDGDEQHLVNRLRDNGDLTLSLVALDGARIVGHIAFSPVKISDGTKNWFGLGPVSVWPELHHRGIGGVLIKRGIAEMRGMGARGIVLLGSNQYYPRFGFEHFPQLKFPGPPAEFFQALSLEGDVPTGVVEYSPAFG